MKTKQESSTASVRHNYAAQWRNDRPVVYGVREAAQKIGCTVNIQPAKHSKSFRSVVLLYVLTSHSLTAKLASQWGQVELIC